MVPVSILVWGSGFFGRKWLETLKGREDCRVAGIVSRSPEGLSPLRRELDLPGVPGFRTLEEAVAASDAEAVIVALPEMLHREAIVAALGAGLHVLTEKPLATVAEEAHAIQAAARARPDRVVMVSQNFRWRPHTRALRAAVRDGAIGRVGHLMLECRQQIRRTTVEGWRERMADPFLLDFAIHHLDLIRYLTGEEAREVIGVSGDSAACAILTMESGLVVGYNATMVAQGAETSQEGLITLVGERGSLHLDGSSRVSLLGAGDPRPVPGEPVPGGELGYGLAQFVEAIRNGRVPETHLGDNLKSFALLLALMESHRARRAVQPAGVLSLA
jgi:predicted dehydrogenase